MRPGQWIRRRSDSLADPVDESPRQLVDSFLSACLDDVNFLYGGGEDFRPSRCIAILHRLVRVDLLSGSYDDLGLVVYA